VVQLSKYNYSQIAGLQLKSRTNHHLSKARCVNECSHKCSLTKMYFKSDHDTVTVHQAMSFSFVVSDDTEDFSQLRAISECICRFNLCTGM